MNRRVAAGNTLTEYGLCISLLALTSVAGLNLMGNSISMTLMELPKSSGVMQMMSLNFNPSPLAGGGSIQLKGEGYYFQTIDPKTGAIDFQMTSNGNGSVSNATSLEGNQWNSMGQFQIAETLMELAEKQKSAENKAFILRLAEKSYYMGAAEGEIDSVKQLQLHDPPVANNDYGKMNGLTDIKRLQAEILSLLDNPPKNMDPQTIVQVNALSLDVYNIGQSYVNTLKAVSENAPYSFSIPVDQTSGVGKGIPGQALSTEPVQITYCTNLECGRPQIQGGPKVEDVFSIDYLRSVSKEVMSDVGVAPDTVIATFSNANQVNDTAN